MVGIFSTFFGENKSVCNAIKPPMANPSDSLPPFLNNKKAELWADSLMKTMTADERTAQLFMVAAYSKTTEPDEKIVELIRNYKIGGIIFMQGGPGRQIILNNYYQSISKTQLMIGIDGEWGLSMRLDSTMKYPWAMTLGAVRDNKLIYDMGVLIGEDCKRVGIHVNFAPDVDINNNVKNPVIGARSFGDNKYNVANKGTAYALGMQSVGVLANSKHFPGHGDTDKDSHKSLPSILHDKARLDSIELYPFKKLITSGIGSMMVAHLNMPAYETQVNVPTTLSKYVVTDLLQNQLGFKGLIFTDALNMKGVSEHFPPGVADVMALKAGNDVLLFSGDVPKAILEINNAIARSEITREYVDAKCKKILMAKYWMGLNVKQKKSLKNLDIDLHSIKADLINRKLIENSLTLLNNKNEILPLKKLDTLKIATVSIGEEQKTMFQKRIDNYTEAKHFNLKEDADETTITNLKTEIAKYNLVIIGIHKSNSSPWKKYDITDQTKKLISDLSISKKIIVSIFTNTYSLLNFNEAMYCDGLVMSYQNSELAQDYTAQLIFGGVAANGMLPVTIHKYYPYGYGLSTTKIRMKYSIPEDIGMNSTKILEIDEVVKKAIKDSVFPGCQIFAARKGVVVFNKGYGHHSWDKKQKVTENSIYDVASVTKVAASLPIIMDMVDDKKVDLTKTFGDYLPELSGTDKSNMRIIDQLTHQAGLKAWIPFYTRTLEKGTNAFKPAFYATEYSENYPYKVADNVYACKGILDTMFLDNVSTSRNATGNYLYSDLGFYLWMRIIKNVYKVNMDEVTQKYIYTKLGANYTMYNPLNKYSKEQIVPTENDKIFRKQLIHGYVHDQGAAMAGGVAGHAGLFSTANDLGKIMQMYLNKGSYGGEEFFDSEIVDEFTKCRFCVNGNRRGIGWDKPTTNGEGGTACDCVSYLSFGHAGFTGCLVWADPQNELVYVFLSNRVHTNAENKKLITQGQRATIQSIFYDSIVN